MILFRESNIITESPCLSTLSINIRAKLLSVNKSIKPNHRSYLVSKSSRMILQKVFMSLENYLEFSYWFLFFTKLFTNLGS